jgi:hypothetical protein
MRHCRTLFLLLVVLSTSSSLSAQSSFTVSGRLQRVVIERQVEEDPVPFHVALDTQVNGLTVRVLCDTYSSSLCSGLSASRTAPAACDFPNLPAATQASLSALLPCTRSCWVQTGGEVLTYFREYWSCEVPSEAACVSLSGSFVGTPWVDELASLPETQSSAILESGGPVACPTSRPRKL